jgi:molecular chaperone DnaK (HSP70)
MMQKLIERNSTIPTNKNADFTTAEDDQEFVEIKVYEGERPKVKDNNYLGLFRLEGIPKTLKGVPKIKVTFNVDSNGILEVTAEDMKTHSKSAIAITNEKGRLSQSEIEKMLKEAEENKEEDALTLEEGAAREELVNYINRVRKALHDMDDACLTKAEREILTAKVTKVDEWMVSKGGRASETDLESKHQELEVTMTAIMVRLNRGNGEFFDVKALLAEGEKLIYDGGFFLSCGKDIRDLMEDTD